MKKSFPYLAVFFLTAIVAIILLWLLLVFSDPESGIVLALGRLLFGFIHFFRENIPAISWNAATWGPGLGAFLIAVVFLHRWLSRWASRKGRTWSFATSFCLVSLVPVLFVISFIVPGILVQWEMLREAVWIEIR